MVEVYWGAVIPLILGKNNPVWSPSYFLSSCAAEGATNVCEYLDFEAIAVIFLPFEEYITFYTDPLMLDLGHLHTYSCLCMIIPIHLVISEHQNRCGISEYTVRASERRSQETTGRSSGATVERK